MKKILILLLLIIFLSSCETPTDEDIMGEIIGDMLFDVTINNMLEEDFCDKYGEYFDEDDEDNVKCAGSDQFFYTFEEMPLEISSSRKDLSIYYDVLSETNFYWFIYEYSKVELGFALIDNPYILVEKGENWFWYN